MQRNIVLSIIVSGALIAGVIFFSADQSLSSAGGSVAEIPNVEIKDGVQYVTVSARGGYSPRTSTIQPDMPTKLIMKTNGTYDCSASLAIRSVGFQKILQPTGEEIIDLGTPKAGEKIQGTCSMGMYGFEIQAS